MRWVTLAIFWCVVLAILNENSVSGKSCKSLVSDLMKRYMKGMAHCSKTLKFKNRREKSKSQGCILRCVAQKEKLADEKGLVPFEIQKAFIESEFPEDMWDKANTTFSPCMKMTDILDPSDKYCKGFVPLIKCVSEQVNKLCK